ncbi:MAG TPA: hypothetical protein OIM60_03440 [Clostridiaceae bacterium]|nr:hypothetical protein [Clostridiaceae bacterium]
MKYSVLIIESNDFYDYVEDSADGIRYDNLLKADLDRLIELSLERNFSVIVRKYEKEE